MSLNNEISSFVQSVVTAMGLDLSTSIEEAADETRINLTGEDVRWHARTTQQIVKLADQSPRYMLGVRYKF